MLNNFDPMDSLGMAPISHVSHAAQTLSWNASMSSLVPPRQFEPPKKQSLMPEERLAELLQAGKHHPKNPHIIFGDSVSDLALIQLNDVHAVIVDDAPKDDPDGLYRDLLGSEVDLFVTEHFLQALHYPALSPEEKQAAMFDPDLFEEKTGMLAEDSNIYSLWMSLSHRVDLDGQNLRSAIPEEDVRFSIETENDSVPLLYLQAEQERLAQIFKFATGKTHQKNSTFVHGSGVFGQSTQDNLHVDRHEISEDDKMAAAWGGIVAESEYIMLKNQSGKSTEFVADNSAITESNLVAWEENPDAYNHDEIAKRHNAEEVGNEKIIIFKTSELGKDIEDLVAESLHAFVHRGPTINIGESRMAQAFTSMP